MEKGKIRTISGYSGGGTIADIDGRAINFSSSNIVGRNRTDLKVGDFVWFERLGRNAAVKAINIRKCF